MGLAEKHKLGWRSVANKSEFVSRVKWQLQRLQKLPAVVRGFFQDPKLLYIRDVG